MYAPRMSQLPRETEGPGSVAATLLVMVVVFAALIWLAAPWRTSKLPRAKARLRRDRTSDDAGDDEQDLYAADPDDDDDDDEDRPRPGPGADLN
jgi:hypothetical protein